MRMNPDPDWKEQLRKLHPESYAWSLFCCNHDKEMAKDVLQTVYLKVYEGKARFLQRSTLKSWLFSVIRNTAADLFRRSTWTDMELNETHHQIPDVVPVVERDKRNLFANILNGLSRQQHAVLTLVFYHDLTLEEISRTMGISIGSVRVHYERGKENFRRLLIKDKDFEML